MAAVVTLALLTAVTTAAVFVRPFGFRASSAAYTLPDVVTPRAASHRRVLELIGTLIANSRSVLAIHPRGASPYVEIVLWLEDLENPGVMDASEVVVLSHSVVMRTVKLYSLETSADADAETPWADALVDLTPSPPTWPPSDIRAPAFCAAWRDRTDVTARTVAAGVTRFEMNVLPAATEAGGTLRISFTWAEDSADGPDEGSAVIASADIAGMVFAEEW